MAHISIEDLKDEINANPDWFIICKEDLDDIASATVDHWTSIKGHEDEAGVAQMICLIYNMKIRRACGKPDHDERDLVGIEDIGDD